MIQKSLTDVHTGVDSFGYEVSSGGTGEESGEVGHRQWKRNRRRRSTKNPWREIWNKLKKRDVGRHEILFSRGIVTSISFLCSRIINKDTFDKSRRQFV